MLNRPRYVKVARLVLCCLDDERVVGSEVFTSSDR